VSEYAGTITRGWADNVMSEFLDSWTDMIQYNNRYLPRIHYDRGAVSYHALWRNEAAKHMLGEWLIMLDTDHWFAPDLADRLVWTADKHGCDVLSGLYMTKIPPHTPVVNIWTDGGMERMKETGEVLWTQLQRWDTSQEVIQAGSTGAGCLFIRKRVFAAIRKQFSCEPFDILPPFSEDYSFCLRCWKLGVPVWLAPGIESHHVIRTPLWAEDCQAGGAQCR